jgi:hypothetical protein
MRTLFLSGLLLLAPIALAVPFPQDTAGQTAAGGGVATSTARFKLLRTVSGAETSQSNGKFEIQDARTTFFLPDDKRIYMYFEWEGPTGPHHFEGIWRDPTGKVSVISNFDFVAAQNRFGGYWTMDLTSQTMPGNWTIEAHVDGETTGNCTVEILAAPRPAGAPAPPATLLPAELYQRLLSATVTIERTDALGKRSKGLGFVVAEGMVATAFQVIDGATMLRITLPDGQTADTDQIATHNRRQDWAIIKVSFATPPALPAAPADSWSVGDRCAFLQVPESGSRILDECTIVGTSSTPESGPRINIDNAPGIQSEGSVLVNERGQVIGIIGGSLIPGASALQDEDLPALSTIRMANALYHGPMATPFAAVKLSPGEALSTLKNLAESGDFLPLVPFNGNLTSATMTERVQNSGGYLFPADGRFDFSRSNESAYVFLAYESKEKCKCTLQAEVYNLDNRLMSHGAPMPVNLDKNKKVFWTVSIALTSLQPGIYRVDILLEGKLLWRDFFRVTD